MRYLNKIVFINSAHIKYAEINLDGNVHFIGTQGVGKSALLRAILFFYNADTLGLGIPKQKQPYPDYYFQHSNSYIIYEVVRDESKFCVVSYKSQHKVCFRFFDGEYNRSYFVTPNGNVADSWEGIAQQLDANRVFYTKRKIEEYIDYRDILYGNHIGKKSELKRYSILESKDYQHIPKTIQNVFLNSKMEAEFIKQTIIMSLENDIKIDLNQYAHHLNDFETQLNDIRKFKLPSTTTQAEAISKLHIAIKHLEREKIRLSKELVWAVNKMEDDEPELRKKLTQHEDEKKVVEEKSGKLASAFKSKEIKIRGDISILENNLKKVKELKEAYERKNIHQLIKRVEKKNTVEKEQQNLLNEKELLTMQFKEIAHKFQSLLSQLKNQWDDFCNGKNAQKNKINADFTGFKEEVRQRTEKLIADIRSTHKKETDDTRTNWEALKTETNSLKIKKEGIRHQRFFEEEIKQQETVIRTLTANNTQLSLENDNAALQIETFKKHWTLDEQELQKTFEREREKSEAQIATARNKMTEIETYITNSRNSLYGWLNECYPGWENTIGKVIDERNVLFNTSLSPKRMEQSNLFYGVEINLDEIDKTVKTVADYENEKTALSQTIEETRRSLSKANEELQKNMENLKRKYQPKIREQKDAIKENEYAIEQNKTKMAEATVKWNDLTEKAKSEKIKQLEIIDSAIGKAVEAEENAKTEVTRMEDALTKLIRAKEREREKIIEKENEKIQHLFTSIEADMQVEQEANLRRKADIETQQKREFSQKGADTERLTIIDAELERIKAELVFIDENRDTVADYKKDKRDYFDKAGEFKQEKELLEKLLRQEAQKYQQQKEKSDRELELIQTTMSILDKELTRIREDREAFEDFRENECYKSLQDYFTNVSEGSRNEKRVKILIDEIKEIHYDKLHSRVDELRKTATDFLGKFSDENIFKFKKQLTDDKSFLAFAFMLSDFVEERKIEQIEKEVNERFALIVGTIGKETSSLLEESKKIQSIITRINRDFMERNFVGVIRKIELKVDESKNEIVQLLVLIMQYNNENMMDLGEANLFSSENQDKKNKNAVDLLKQFVKKINELKRDQITLADSFELKFRIEENQNDTGWVEKLSSVGSEGTDVLVKAMVNIMLLNVLKESASKRFKDFQLHCMMDEIGKLHPSNVRGILKFANDRNILLINSSPIENDALAFKHIYKLKKDEHSITRINRILTQYSGS